MRAGMLALLLAASVVACEGGSVRPTGTLDSTPTPTSAALIGVSPTCAAAFQRAIEGHADPTGAFTLVANRAAVLNACATVEELETAGRQLGIDDNWAYLAESSCRYFELPEVKEAAICLSLPEETPTPKPAPSPVTAAEAANRDLCSMGRPDDVYAVTAGVTAAEGSLVRNGVHLVLLEFKDLDGAIGPVPAVERGFIYKTTAPYEDDAEIFDATGAVRILACIALRAVEEEQWGTPGRLGVVECPCTIVHASDALVWMVDPADGRLAGLPWRRPPIDVESQTTHMILAGLDGLGLRPPEQSDIVADIKVFLGL